MLQSFEFENFQSFREPVVVDLTINKKTALTSWMAESKTGERLSKLMAVVGANGSGKTALLKPMAFLSWFVVKSFQQAPDALIPVAPHFASTDAPVSIKCTFEFEGKLWRYELKCTPTRVLHEALYLRRERFGYVFVRDWDASSHSYEIKQQDFGFNQREAKKVRPNASLISTALQYGVPMAQMFDAMNVWTNVNVLGRLTIDDASVATAADYFAKVPGLSEQMSQLLAAWDMGLTGVTLKQVPAPLPNQPDQMIWMPFGEHTSRQKSISLPFVLESSGTRGAFVLLSFILPVLEHGGLAIIDEFENDLHPLMLEPILDLFANPKTNPHNAQLIFSCHAIEVLNLVEKSQVMLVKKNEECESSACRMDAVVGIRNDSNFYAKYMAGAYGAVPNL